MSRTLIIVRTHRADAASLAAYDVFAGLPGFEVVFCVDERAGAADMAGRDKVVFTLPVLAELGVYAHPNCGWQCGDYCYLVTRTARPDYDFYWLIEPDVRINAADLGAFFARFAASEADLLAPRFGPRNDVWWWTRTIKPVGMEPHGCLFPITRLSGRAIDHVLVVRRRLSADPAVATQDRWPNDESLTASALVDGGFVCLDLNHGGIICHDRQSLGAGSVVDFNVVARLPPDGLIYHPVRDFVPWLERAEARIAALDPDRTRGKAARLRGQASYMASVALACVRHPDFLDSGLVPMMLADNLWSERPWLAAGAPEREAGDRHEGAVVAQRLARRFGPGRLKPLLATAQLAACRTGAERMTTARPEEFETAGNPVPLGHFPRNVALPFAWDIAARELMFTLHVTLSGVLAAPFLYAAQREMTRAVARVKLDALPRIYGPPDPAASPVLIFSLGRTGSTLLEKLIGCVTPRSISEPDALTQLAASRRVLLEMPQAERRALIYYAIAPFFRVQIPGGDGSRCVIKFRSQVNGIAGQVAETFPAARYVFMLRERRAWARSTFRSFRLSPAAVVERALQGLAAAQALRGLGVDMHVVFYEGLIADPIDAVARLTATDVAGDPALARRIAETMAQDSQAAHRLSREATSKPVEGEDSWMAAFEALWAEKCPDDLLTELKLSF